MSIHWNYRWDTPTTKVVWAEVDSCAPPSPECGSSWSVIRNTRFIAVFGALICPNQFDVVLPMKQAYPSRIAQLQLVNTSPNGTCPFRGGNWHLRYSGLARASIAVINLAAAQGDCKLPSIMWMICLILDALMVSIGCNKKVFGFISGTESGLSCIFVYVKC